MPGTPDSIRIPSYFNAPKVLPCAEWLPDQANFNNQGCTVATNVAPKSLTSYGPVPALSPIGYPALPSQPFGLYSFIDQTGNVHIFTGTITKLFRLHTGDSSFIDVSQAAHTYAASIDNPWSMTAFANSVIATNGADAPQIFTIGGTTFTDLGGSPPIARYGATVRDFVMLGNTNESGNLFPQRVHWSSIGNANSWPTIGTTTAAANQSDAQDLRADMGFIRGLASGLQSADVAVFMDRGVYSGVYVGSPAVFSFQIVQGADGCQWQNTIVSHRGVAYYLSTAGFMAFDGVSPRPIGAQKIDNFYFNDPNHAVSTAFLDRTVGGSNPVGRFIYWLYCGPQSTGIPNRMLIYNYLLDRWGLALIDAVWIGRSLTLGYSLDNLDQFGTLDTLPFSLDSLVWAGGSPVPSFFDKNFQLASFGLSNLAATIETAEVEPSPDRRSRVTGLRPLVDGTAICTAAVGSRNRLGDAVSYTTPISENWTGLVPVRTDARYIRAQVNIPAGATWTHVQGAGIDFAESTKR